MEHAYVQQNMPSTNNHVVMWTWNAATTTVFERRFVILLYDISSIALQMRPNRDMVAPWWCLPSTLESPPQPRRAQPARLAPTKLAAAR